MSSSLPRSDVTGWTGWIAFAGYFMIIVGFFGALHMIAQFASVSAYPLWGVIAIALDAIILYALLVHGREMSEV